MSLEPVLTAEFANTIINATTDVVDYFRVGKDDLLIYDWVEVRKNIIKEPKIYIK